MTPISRKMRVVICGQKWFGAAVFDAMMNHPLVDVCAVWSPQFSRRGHEDALRRKARLYEIQWNEAGTLRADLLPPETDLLIAAHSHDFVGRLTRKRLKIGAIGYHPSLLPIHRGRSSVEWAIKMGDPVTGGTVFWLDDVVDGGPVISQDWCFVRRGDDAASLWRRDLAPIGLKLISEAVSSIAAGEARSTPQDHSLATWEPSIDSQPLFRPELLELTA